MSILSIIVAIAENGAIGQEQQLLCHLPKDLKRFKEITNGHTVIMGRKTFESLPKGALPNRKNVVLTTSPSVSFPNCIMVHSLDEALQISESEEEVFVIGGAAVYKLALEKADKLYITRIHHQFEDADTFFPEINESEWQESEREFCPADEKHAYPFTFVTYVRRS
ncbi:dihydrofolate reductase [Massilibacteroides sp.]|uniref:dihydrofolate reductase n=1 Tax=Massilibacteroides sp. TaxID=2034766 RepID=UPI00260FAC38|nr:dihydrofolate reductase [Massilibacteroides sp.]MDD4514030.1 dihydrofolate reductase [Massilibacteroides sp.]